MTKLRGWKCFSVLMAVLLILGLAAVLIPADLARADTVVTFPDANLEAAIRDALSKPAGDIYASELAGLTNLWAEKRGIADLTGLERCTNLTNLFLGGNHISNLMPLAFLTNLTWLGLGGNQISDISPLASLINLTNLDLSVNQISDISLLVSLTNLTGINLGANQISNISPLASLTNLTSLELGQNQINDISPLASLANLIYLGLNFNQISNISPLASLTNLTSLILQVNQINNLTPLAGLTSIIQLELGSNQIIDLTPIVGLTNLNQLNLDNNQISNLAPMAGLTNLTNLFLDNNQVSDIASLVDNMGLAIDDTVYLRGNPLNQTSIDTQIPALQARGVTVIWGIEPPPPPPPPPAPPITESVWHTLNTPAIGSEILSPSEVNKITVAQDGATIWAVDTPARAIRKSSDRGLSWSDGPNSALHSAMASAGIPENNQVIWDAILAPDNSNIVAVVTGSAISPNPAEVWLSTNGGTDWECKGFASISGGAMISAIDISLNYGAGDIGGGKRDIAVGARDGVPGAFRLWVIQVPSSNPWKFQTVVPADNADIVALKFSPECYANVAYLASVFCTDTATYYNIAIRDLDPAISDTVAWVYASPGIEVKAPGSPSNDSPEATTIVNAAIELPSDFMGQAASQRRAYISLNSYGAATKSTTARDGIFRIDDAAAYVLMDTSQISSKSICSLAYYGTYDSGKLLAGEVLGYPCTATVPTWFTDSPTACPIPCWYPSLKPPTGAARQGSCTQGLQAGFGNAQVAWSPDGMLAYCGTSSADFRSGGVNTAPGSGCWPAALLTSIALDESAFSLTRNNGETWNQTGLIDTMIDKLTDIAPSADSSTIYLASVNDADNPLCAGFDSVWRSSSNTNVIYPFPPQPIGTVWERVLTKVTSENCAGPQTNKALLRVVPYSDDPTGEIVAWGVHDPTSSLARGVAAWSPDHGDYWQNISVRHPIQDFCFESRYVLYCLNPNGLVQKMPYTGTTWCATLPDVSTGLASTYSIAAMPDGKVVVGSAAAMATSYCHNFNTDSPSFATQVLSGTGNVHVAFDANFTSNGIIYIATNKGSSDGSIYRNTVPSYGQWTDLKPLSLRYYGLAVSPQGTLYAANQRFFERTLHPDVGIPGDNGAWDILNAGLPDNVSFTLSPNSLKLSSTAPSKNTLYVIDDAAYVPTADRGRLWMYNDSLPVEAKTYTNAEYCFSLQYPGNWEEDPYSMTTPLHLAAFRVPSFVPGAIIAALDADAPMSVDWIVASFQEMGYQNPAVISPLTQTTLADGTIATTYQASFITSTGYEAVAFCLDADRCDKRIRVMVFTIEAFSPYNEAQFSEIAHTLTFTCTCGQPHTASVLSATGTGIVTFSTDIGTITDLTAVAEGTLPTDGKPAGVTFPHGLFAFKIIGIPLGATATVTITFPSSLLPGTQYWKYQAGIGWYQIPIVSHIANVIVIQLTDGGMGDADKVVNQIIVDPGGSGVMAGVVSAIPSPRSSPSPPQPLWLPPADVRLHNVSVSPSQAQVGQPVTVLANVVNNGGSSGNYNVMLRINGRMEQQRMIEISPGTAYPVQFTVTRTQPGTYTVNVGDQKATFVILGASNRPGRDTREGPVLVAAMTVIVSLFCLVILAARRRLQGY